MEFGVFPPFGYCELYSSTQSCTSFCGMFSILSGNCGSHGNPVFNFLRNLYTVSESSCTTFRPQQQKYTGFHVSWSSSDAVSVLLITAIRVHKSFPAVLVIHIPLLIGNDEHLFTGFAGPLLRRNVYSNPAPAPHWAVCLCVVDLQGFFICSGY